MKKNAGKITIAVLFLIICIIIAYVISPVFAVVRSYDQDVQTISMSSVVTANTDQMFTVSGGRIEIVSLFGECTTDMAGDPGAMTILLDATTSAQDRDFTTAVSVNALNAGDVIRFTNAIDEGVLTLTTGVGAGQTLSWFCSPGEIEQYTASTGTGNITWYMSYRKLEATAVVTAN